MRAEELEFLYKLEETFWWFAGMRQITDTVLAKPLGSGAKLRILDAGCGTGFNVVHFASLGPHEVFAIDLSADAIEWVRRRGIHKLARANVTAIPYATASFDVVCSFDVICQGKEPPVEGGLREMHRVLKPGGYMFVRVPAYGWMRSSHDVDVDTNRRFTRSELRELVMQAGFKVESISYANCFLFPVVLVRRLLKSVGVGEGSDVRPVANWLNVVLETTLKSEVTVLRAGLSLPFGLSVVCLARKP